MKLTLDEFKLIRPLQYRLQDYGNMTYYSPINQTQTQLFWLDFIRLIFAKKYAQQIGRNEINNFDQTQPVLLTDDLDLKLPSPLATVVYYADNKIAPKRFILNVNRLILVVSTIILILVVALMKNIFSKNSSNLSSWEYII